MSTPSALPVKRQRGRRSVQTPERAQVICHALARGLPYVHACAVAGISFQTFSVWRDRDAAFRQAIEEAIARGVEKRLKASEKASDLGDWRASAWLLEHCQPEHFAKTRIQLEHVGQMEVGFVIPQQTLNEIAEARKRHEHRQLEANGA